MSSLLTETKISREHFKEEIMDRIDANNQNLEVHRGTLVSGMHIHQARTVSTREEMKAKMNIHQEKMKVAIHSVRSSCKRPSNFGCNMFYSALNNSRGNSARN
jgi:hypothetical protein